MAKQAEPVKQALPTEQYGDLKEIRFLVTAVEGSSLLMNNPAAMLRGVEEDPAGVSVRSASNVPTAKDEAARSLYRLPSEQLYLPATHFRQGIWFAAGSFKLGKITARAAIGSGLFIVEPEELPLFDPETGAPITDYEVDVRRAVVRSGFKKVGVSRARARVPSWATHVCFQYEPLLLNETSITTFFERAGAISGVGDYRPNCGGSHGRYRVQLVQAADMPALRRA